MNKTTSYPDAKQRWVSSGRISRRRLTGGLPSPPAVSGNDVIWRAKMKDERAKIGWRTWIKYENSTREYFNVIPRCEAAMGILGRIAGRQLTGGLPSPPAVSGNDVNMKMKEQRVIIYITYNTRIILRINSTRHLSQQKSRTLVALGSALAGYHLILTWITNPSSS